MVDIEFVNLHAPARTPEGTKAAADLIGCDVPALEAVMMVEAGKKGFDSKGRVVALFEPHIFYRELSDTPETKKQACDCGLAYSKWGAKPYPKDSYSRIASACEIDPDAALRSTSWGLPQMMGFNHHLCGYKDAAAMHAAFLTSEDEQVMAMARFIKKAGLSTALKKHDWATFAKGYNGSGYKKNKYDEKLAKAYAKASK